MIVEQALLHVDAARDAAYRAALDQARPLIAASPGFLGMEIRPAAGEPGCYLLLVRWERIEDHRDGFRQSERYARWRELLHPFYDPMPQVRYFGDPI